MTSVCAIAIWLAFVLVLHWLGLQLQTYVWNKLLREAPPE